ncbi:hypothetical protein AKJ39_02610 [candidate division MSBL1 archaeon SCGC-AAA259J03]|uniref:Uncharacterized protein n=2 Tax=candidate division MSBL1 TaxID=215777 RepID=A0A656YY62_9EURY|nr:hypothetical protein AKJ61_03465 [candidate division MSBL1 archaeon SCGC-AAA259B11]KXA98048.1 hypothetical protein AKJ39_02610 [candidate division MSBL1 archaeon SCGC-AAA259J03]
MVKRNLIKTQNNPEIQNRRLTLKRKTIRQIREKGIVRQTSDKLFKLPFPLGPALSTSGSPALTRLDSLPPLTTTFLKIDIYRGADSKHKIEGTSNRLFRLVETEKQLLKHWYQ